jgi:predicted DNA-binding transcriptional regulator AlpA
VKATTAGTRIRPTAALGLLHQPTGAATAPLVASCRIETPRTVGAATTMTQLGDRAAYTRADLMARYGLGLSTLEGWYRDRAETGHPQVAGKAGRALAWDAAEWDTWYNTWRDTTGLADFDDLAELVGRSRSTVVRLWAQRDTNGHPATRKRIDGTLYWDPDEYRDWFENEYRTSNRTAGVDFGGNAADELTLAEFGRLLGLAPNTTTVYAKRPPAGWPEPVIDELLASGRHRRRYTRQQAWDYSEQYLGQRHPGGGRPAGTINGARRYPYEGDPRLDIARAALADTPAENQGSLPMQLASRNGSTPGTWAGILSAARRRPTPPS